MTARALADAVMVEEIGPHWRKGRVTIDADTLIDIRDRIEAADLAMVSWEPSIVDDTPTPCTATFNMSTLPEAADATARAGVDAIMFRLDGMEVRCMQRRDILQFDDRDGIVKLVQRAARDRQEAGPVRQVVAAPQTGFEGRRLRHCRSPAPFRPWLLGWDLRDTTSGHLQHGRASLDRLGMRGPPLRHAYRPGTLGLPQPELVEGRTAPIPRSRTRS